MPNWIGSEFEILSRSLSGIGGDIYLREVSRGNVEGASVISSYGKRTTAGAESNILWPNGTYTLPPAVGTTVSLISTSAQDAAGGTGIESVEVHYLDANLEPQTATVTLTGLTEVTNAISGVRFIECMHMVTYGSGKAAAGNISAYDGSGTYSYISVGARRCSSSVRMVPKGKRLLTLGGASGVISGTAAAQGSIAISTTKFSGTDYSSDSVFIPLMELGYQDNSFGLLFPVYETFTEGTAVGMNFSVDKAATITGSWFGILENA